MRSKWVRTTMLVMTLGLGAIALAPTRTPDAEDRRGCCSHHGGVCGCAGDAHALKCCDGALSPTCGCRAVRESLPGRGVAELAE